MFGMFFKIGLNKDLYVEILKNLHVKFNFKQCTSLTVIVVVSFSFAFFCLTLVFGFCVI